MYIPVGADLELLVAHPRTHSETGVSCKVGRLPKSQGFLLGGLHDGRSYGMFGKRLHGSDLRQQDIRIHPFRDLEVRQSGPAFGQCPGLIESDHLGIS